MPYSEYKKLYGKYKTVYGTYDNEKKTIVVELPDDVEYVPIQKKHIEKWHEILININNLKRFRNSCLIKMPYCSEYRNWVMWCSEKLIHNHEDYVSMSVKESFCFTIKNDTEQKEISGSELISIFDISLSDQEEPELHIPKKLEPVKTEALEELKDE